MASASTALFTVSVFACWFAGCAATSRPRVEVFPDGGQVDWRSGRGVVSQERGAVQVSAAYDFATPDLLAFRLAVENRSDAPLVIDTRRIYFAPCTANKACPTAEPVLGPELILADLDRQQAKAEAEADDARLRSDILLILGATVEITSIATGRTPHGSGLLVASALSSEDRASRFERRIDEERRQWSSAALRSTTLGPEERVSGYVFVPFDSQAKFVWLDVLAGGQRFSFRFEQFTPAPAVARKQTKRASDPPE